LDDQHLSSQQGLLGVDRLCRFTGTFFGPGFVLVLTFRVLHPIN